MLIFKCPNGHVYTFDLGSHLDPMQAIRFREVVLTTFCPTCWEEASVRGSFIIGQDAAGQSWIKGFIEQIISEPNARETAQTVVGELRDVQETLSRTGEQPDDATVSPHTKGVLEKLRSLSTEAKIAIIIGIIGLLLQVIALYTDDDPSTVYQYTIEQQTIEKQVIRREQPRAAGQPPDGELAEYDTYDILQEALDGRQVMSAYSVPGGTSWGQNKPGLNRLLLHVYAQLTTLFPGCALTLQVEPRSEVGQYSDILVHIALPELITEDPEGPKAQEVLEILQRYGQEIGQRYVTFRRWLDSLNSPAREQLKFKLEAPVAKPINPTD